MWLKTVFVMILLSISKYDAANHRKTTSDSRTFEPKIINGTAVSIEKYPYAVQFLNKGSLCGGVILHSRIITTAAHCIVVNDDIEDMAIRAGGSTFSSKAKGDRYNVRSVVVHENYNKKQTFACDIALVFSNEPIRFSDRVQKAILVDNIKWMSDGVGNFHAIGWGHTEEGGDISRVGLQMTILKFVSLKKCSVAHNNYRFTEEMFCLYGDGITDTCQGDSGGGVFWNNMLVGLTSHGDGCARAGKPSVYLNIWEVKNWIKKHTLELYAKYCGLPVVRKNKKMQK